MGFNNKNLTDIIYQYKDTKFSWGYLDCCIFTVNVVEEFKNIKLPFWREVITYDGYKGAMKSLKNLGCNKLEDLPSIILNTKKEDISKAKLGDPVYYINEKGIVYKYQVWKKKVKLK